MNKNFNTLSQIADRYLKKYPGFGKKIDVVMDLDAVITGGCSLRLDELLAASDFNFFHDVCGIRENLDRNTGALKNCFSPRYSV